MACFTQSVIADLIRNLLWPKRAIGHEPSAIVYFFFIFNFTVTPSTNSSASTPSKASTSVMVAKVSLQM